MSHRPQKDIDKAIANLIKYSERDGWKERKNELFEDTIAEAAEALAIAADELIQVIEKAGLMGMVFGYLFEVLATRRWDDEEFSMIDDYLKRRGWREAPYAKRYLSALNASKLTLWEVVSVKAGQCVDLRSFGSEATPLRVYEKAGTQGLKRWDCLVARVIVVDGKHGFSGSILPFSPEQMQEISLKMKEEYQLDVEAHQEVRSEQPDCLWSDEEIQTMAKQDIADLMPELVIRRWISDAYLAIMRPMPTLVNRDGDHFQWSKVKFPMSQSNIEAIKQRLNSAPLLAFNDANQEWAWLVREGEAVPKQGALLLGYIALEKHYLVLSVNSLQRADDGKAYLGELLGDLIGQPLTLHESMESLKEKYQSATPSPSTRVDAPELITAYMDQHYKATLDKPIPALGNRTPRECARQADKQLLIQWLKGLENSTLSVSNMAHYDFKWMWEALGVDYPT